MIKVFQIGKYIPESGDGVKEFLYQYGKLLKNDLEMNYVAFDLQDEGYMEENLENVKIFHFNKKKIKTICFSKKFKNWIKDKQKDCIFHLHGNFNPFNFFLAVLLVTSKLKYIYTPHDSYSKESLEQKKWLKLLYISIVEKYILNNASIIHALTKTGEMNIAKYTKNNITIIPNFLYNEHNIDLNCRNKQICFIGRFDIFQKGIDLMIDVLAELKKQNSYIPKTIFVGAYDIESLAKVKSLCLDNKLFLNENLIITGKVNEKEKCNILKKSLIYFQLSRFEGFGISIIEALSFGIPVVISNNIPIKDVILMHRAGFVVGNNTEAVNAIKKIIDMNKEEYQLLSLRAKKCYENEFSANTIKPRIIKMYEEVLSK